MSFLDRAAELAWLEDGWGPVAQSSIVVPRHLG